MPFKTPHVDNLLYNIAYAMIANATAAPPNAHFTLPPTAATPPVLVLPCTADEVCVAPLEVVPDADVFTVVLEPDVFAVVEPVLVVDGTAELGDPPEAATAPAVITTGMKARSVPLIVSVATPGSLASVPPYDSVQTAEIVPASEQSI